MEQEKIERMIDEYVSGKSANKISIYEKINISSLMRILRKNNVKVRTVGEGVDLFYNDSGRDNINLSEELKEIIYGNLLGDGCVRKGKSEIRGQYSHVDKNLEYILWLKKLLSENGVETYHNQTKGKSKCFYLQTNTYNVFSDFRKLFYVDGKRIVPKQTKLTPIIFRQWFISDGSIATSSSALNIAKSPFNETLMKEIRDILGDGCTYHFEEKRGCGKFYIPARYSNDFYNYIGKSPVACYDYKWKKEK